MGTRVQVVGATVWRDGRCCAIAGVDDGRRGVLAVASCEVPRGVGARGGKLARVASKVARSKALKRVARAALQKATLLPAAQAGASLTLARTALAAAKQLDREVREDNGPDDDQALPDIEVEEYELE